MIDSNGRIFGRFNLVDAVAAAFVVLLLPIGYATYLLFRPAQPVIDSVTRVPPTKEEQRIASGSILTAKLKVRGSGFSPLLRAQVGPVAAIGFVFESPNSADVLVGLIPVGKHDLVLYDGVQEVARARDAVEVQAEGGPAVRLYGFLTKLDPAEADTIKAGFASPPTAPNAFQIVSIGPTVPAHARVITGTQAADLPMPGMVERAAELIVRCDWPSLDACAVNGEPLTQTPPINIILPGGMRFEINEIGPPSNALPAVAHLRLDAVPAGFAVGDRDPSVGAGAAEVTQISGSLITLKLGVHESREGWRYRGQLLTPGSKLTLRTRNTIVIGTITDVTVQTDAK
jgi:hypothetical protein